MLSPRKIYVCRVRDAAESLRYNRHRSSAVASIRKSITARLGFELARAPLFDAEATGHAIRKLVADDLAKLGAQDSLIVFFAGHGEMRTQRIADTEIETGYLLPVDAERELFASWIDLDDWLE